MSRTCSRSGPRPVPATEAQLAAKIESLKAVIDAQNPDVLALQEVGGEQVLARLQDPLAAPLPHRAVGIPDERGIRVALISRLELHDRADIQPFPTGLLPIQVGDDPPGPDGPRLMNQMGRGALKASVTVGNRDVHLVTTHLKSKLLTLPGGFAPADEDQRARFAAYALYRRTSEATTLRSHLDALLNGAAESWQ
jgi:Endonuclease/Exonuclease/phosphatase family